MRSISGRLTSSSSHCGTGRSIVAGPQEHSDPNGERIHPATDGRARPFPKLIAGIYRLPVSSVYERNGVFSRRHVPPHRASQASDDGRIRHIACDHCACGITRRRHSELTICRSGPRPQWIKWWVQRVEAWRTVLNFIFDSPKRHEMRLACPTDALAQRDLQRLVAVRHRNCASPGSGNIRAAE